jgi:hypothetical protein
MAEAFEAAATNMRESSVQSQRTSILKLTLLCEQYLVYLAKSNQHQKCNIHYTDE